MTRRLKARPCRQATRSSQKLDTPEIYPGKGIQEIQEIDAPMEERSNGRKPRDDGRRDWSHAVRSRGTPGATRSWKMQGRILPSASEKAQPCQHIDCRLLASRTGSTNGDENAINLSSQCFKETPKEEES
ncbi:uncharacterized protein LOC144616102 isoform X2 [Panthera onca]